MFINPKQAIQEGWVKGIVNEDVQVQPNAIDFTLDKMFTISNETIVMVSDVANVKQMAGGEEIQPLPDPRYNDNFFRIGGHMVVDGMSNIYVDLPEGVACQLIVRSTFNRNGIFITSGLYDSGYLGHIGFAIHNRRSNPAFIGQGTRIGQIIFVESNTSGLYSGGWNHEEGTHYSEE